MSKKNMPNFDSLLLSGDESDISNDANREWWQSNPMTYDWDKSLGEPIYNKQYFKKIDDIFGEGHSLINNPNWPDGFILENFIDYNLFKSKNVLEIGCGAGLVSSHIAKAGGKLHAIDLTNEAIIMTKERFSLENLEGDVRQMDAEHMEFESDSMDYIVSWGVIHHSSNMQAIIDEIHRVLKPGGEAYIMVYNKLSLRYQIYVKFWLGIMKLKFLTKSTEQIAGSITDGFIARHLTSDDFRKAVSSFSSSTITFSDEKTTTLKYLFGVGRLFAPFYPITQYFERWLARKWGWYLECKIKK